jgi:Ca2+:H+ antiporter
MILLALTGLIGILTVSLGTAIVLEGVIHLLIFAAFLFIAVTP